MSAILARTPDDFGPLRELNRLLLAARKPLLDSGLGLANADHELVRPKSVGPTRGIANAEHTFVKGNVGHFLDKASLTRHTLPHKPNLGCAVRIVNAVRTRAVPSNANHLSGVVKTRHLVPTC
jgi:hypothetical protein